MARATSINTSLHRRDLDTIFSMYDLGIDKFHADIVSKALGIDTINYKFQQEGDFGMAAAVDQLGPIGTDDIFHGFEKTITPIKRGLGFDMATEVRETDVFSRFANIVPKMKYAFHKTEEQVAANLINNATSTTSQYLLGDGKALAATDHPLYGGATDSNLMTDALGILALEKIAAKMKQIKGHRGDPDPRMPPYTLFVHPDQESLANRLIQPGGLPSTNVNDRNVVSSKFTKVVASPYFTSTTFFSIKETGVNDPFMRINRRGITTKQQEDIDVDMLKFRLTQIYAMFAKTWRGYYHSTGAGS